MKEVGMVSPQVDLEYQLEQMKNVAKSIELSRLFTYSEIARIEKRLKEEEVEACNNNAICRVTVNPMPGNRNYVHLIYDGMLPLYMEDHKYKREMRRFYNFATGKALEGIAEKPNFKKAFIYIVHIFPNFIRRDYDNRGRKFIIDALRYSGVIEDDNWMNIHLAESGFSILRELSRVEVFICDIEDKLLMIEYVDKFHVKALSVKS
jgi:hypothetical protein